MKSIQWPLALLFYCTVFTSIQHAQEKRTHQITLDDYFTQEDVFSAVISPGGEMVAYTAGRWNKEADERHSFLWVIDAKTRKPRRLTNEGGHDHSPQWSADGRWIYFLGSRKQGEKQTPPYDGSTQLWRIKITGGAPEAVTRIKGGVKGYTVSPTDSSVYILTAEKHIEDEWKTLRQQHSKVNYGHGVRQVHVLWRLNPDTWRRTKLLDNHRVIREMTVSTNNKRLAMITTPDNSVLTFEGQSQVDILDLKTGKVATLSDKLFREEKPSPYGWLQHLAWSPDGQRLAFNVIFDAYPSEIIVAEWKGNGVRVSQIERPKDVSLRGYGSPLGWLNDTDLCFLGDRRAFSNVYCVRGVTQGTQNKVDTLIDGNLVVDGFTTDGKSSSLAIVKNDTKSLADIYHYSAASGMHRLTDLNPQVASWKLPLIRKVTWKGAGGKEVEGILELPADYRGGKPLPLIVELHGGPTTCTRCQFRFWIYGRTLLPSQGYALLSPNYRGSTGYGDKFLTDLVGHENEIEVEDILKGVEAMIDRGIADPERLGVMGWSNGGYLTNCLITHTPRFKAASSGASILDTVMEWGSNDEPAYVISFKKGFPWNRPDSYQRTSPTYQLHKVRTPTLIHVGANDERCPPSHSRMLYRALKEYVKVPTELLIYPGEPHGLRKYSSRRAKMAWDLAWFKKYLK